MAAKERIESIHILRGITIAVIVFRHSLSYFDSRSLPVNFFAQIVDEASFNWTVFFVIISGYLFQHLSSGFETQKYWLSRFKNVLMPYFVISLVCFPLLHWHTVQALPWFSTDGNNLVFWAFRMLLTGEHSEPLWYLPMITVIFCLSPLLFALSQKDMTIIAVICLLLSVMTFKPDPQETLKNVLHYLPVYIVGMFLCQKSAFLRRYCAKNFPVLIVFFLIIMAMSFHKKMGLAWLNISDDYLMTLEKIVLFVILYHFLENTRLPGWCNKVFSYFADISFSVYFIHMLIIKGLLATFVLFPWWHGVTTFESGVLSTLMNMLFTVLVLALCSIIVTLVKRVAGKNSRVLIGS